MAIQYTIEVEGGNVVVGGELAASSPVDNGGESLLIGRNEWDGIYFLQDLGRSWSVGKSIKGLLVELAERDTLDSLIEWLGATDEERDEARRLEWESDNEAERRGMEREAMAVITR